MSASHPGLSRQLGLGDAVALGMGAMIGAGIFAVLGPAAEAAGSALLIGLALAAVVAYANAASSAQLAAVYPESGGTYAYGRHVLGPLWGYLAGWAFVVGKTASLAAMALTVGAYAWPTQARGVALAAVAVGTGVNYRGVGKTARATKAILTVVLFVLAVLVVFATSNPGADASNLADLTGHGFGSVFQAAGLLFFAFAGYARIATLGEEVKEPARTIPRAIVIALAVTLVIYAAVAVSALFSVGPGALAASPAPLATAAQGRFGWLPALVRVGGAVAAFGVLLSLLAGVSRTIFAMARNRDLPAALAGVHPVHRTPHRAEIAIGLVVAGLTAFTDLRGAIGFSSFAVLTYYAIANVAAFRQPPPERMWPRPLPVLGLMGCVALAFSLPAGSVLGGLVVLSTGLGARWMRQVGRPDHSSPGGPSRRGKA